MTNNHFSKNSKGLQWPLVKALNFDGRELLAAHQKGKCGFRDSSKQTQ
jgi:hypothetical protein